MWGVKEKDMVMGDCQFYGSACVAAGELFRYAHRELDAVLRLGAQGLRPDARFAHGIDGVVYCVDKDADIFEELYNARLVRGLVIENRVDELFGLRNIQRTLYDCIGRGVQLLMYLLTNLN